MKKDFGREITREEDTERYAVIHKLFYYLIKDRSLHDFITKTSLYKNIYEF